MNLASFIQICKKHNLPNRFRAVIPEPYAPLIPKNWNGILVLAEAQNLSKRSNDYRNRLRALSKKDRYLRLYLDILPDGIGIQPWDNGALKLAALAMYPKESLERFAVSNAVPWSVVKGNDSNKNPTDSIEKHAKDFWLEILSLLKPERIICAGRVASRVIGNHSSATMLRLPAPHFINGLSDLFDHRDLLNRYPEVSRALSRLPGARSMKDLSGKILYACHAVSKCKADKA
jgi:hypothetical protein